MVWSQSIASQTDVPRCPDASTLRVTAFNVGIMQEFAHIRSKDKKIEELAGYVKTWLEDGYAAVGLNEIHLKIAEMLQRKMKAIGIIDIEIAINVSDCLLWRIPL